jgi:hypothetical protein
MPFDKQHFENYRDRLKALCSSRTPGPMEQFALTSAELYVQILEQHSVFFERIKTLEQQYADLSRGFEHLAEMVSDLRDSHNDLVVCIAAERASNNHKKGPYASD